MTNTNGDGLGGLGDLPFGPRPGMDGYQPTGRPPFAPEYGGKEPAPGVTPSGVPVVPADGLEPSLSGLQLPTAFSTAHFLDPNFIAGIANALFNEGSPAASINNPAEAGREAFSEAPIPFGATPPAGFERPDFSDPRFFMPPSSPPDVPGIPGVQSAEQFYFLPGAANAAPPVGLGATPQPGAPVGATATPALPPPSSPFALASGFPTPFGAPSGLEAPSFGDVQAVPTVEPPRGAPGFVGAPGPGKFYYLPSTGGLTPAEAPNPFAQPNPTTGLLSSKPAAPAAAPASPLDAVNETEAYYFLPQPAPPAAAPTQGAAPAGAAAKPSASPYGRQFEVETVRKDFPALHQRIHGKPLIWLDNAATTQKPQAVIDAISRFYSRDNSNIHRAAHTLAARATGLYEEARDKVRRFVGAGQIEEIVFVHGATEAINLVAQTYGRQFIGPGDEIIVSTIEHHANIVPWQHLAKEKGAVIKVIPVNDRGEILLEDYGRLLGPKTKLVAVTHVSNALGTLVPVKTITELAHRHGAKVLIDGAQSAPHMRVDVQNIDADFYVLAGHKIFGPTGIGALYGKREVLETMPPWQGGGNMIDQVSFEQTTYQQAPAKFEAGTGILAGAIGLGAAIDYLEEIGLDVINAYEHELVVHAAEALGSIPGVRLIGTAVDKASVVSFTLEGVRNEDLGRYLDQEGIAVRAGHHCAQPTMRRFGVSSTVRPSLAFYNTHAEIDTLAAAVKKAKVSLT